MKLSGVLYDIYIAMDILKMNNIPVKPVKIRGACPQDVAMKLIQRCGCKVKSLLIDQGMIKLEMKSLCTDEDLREVMAKIRSFSRLEFNYLDRVQSMSLPNSCITGKGILLFENFRNLNELGIPGTFCMKGNEFNDLICVKTLERLDLSNNYKIGKEGIEAIMFMKGLPRLKHANLQMTGVDNIAKWDSFMKELLSINPELEILYDKSPYGF
jgi:hypothetical protein